MFSHIVKELKFDNQSEIIPVYLGICEKDNLVSSFEFHSILSTEEKLLMEEMKLQTRSIL